jgi:hypothetical protein
MFFSNQTFEFVAEPKPSSKKAAPRSRKFPMRQTRALSTCCSAKNLENQSQATGF